jgi:signal transduction histidine kinase
MNPKALEDLTHDLINKLAVIQLRALKLQKQKEPGQDRDLESILLAVNRSTDILASMRVIISSGIAPINMEDIMQSLERFYGTLEKIYNVRLVLDYETERLSTNVRVDMRVMTRVIENIIENAANAGATRINIVNRIIDGRSVSRYQDNGRGCERPELIGTGYTTSKGEGHGRGAKMLVELVAEQGGTITWNSNAKGGIDTVTSLQIIKEGTDESKESG